MAKPTLIWHEIDTRKLPDAVDELWLEYTERESELRELKSRLADALRPHLDVPAGHTIRVGTAYGKLSVAFEPGSVKRTIVLK